MGNQSQQLDGGKSPISEYALEDVDVELISGMGLVESNSLVRKLLISERLL